LALYKCYYYYYIIIIIIIICADILLKTVVKELSYLYRFCHLTYGNGTTLLLGSDIIWSLEGVQQDPLGPVLFFLTVQPLLRSLLSQMIVVFMDDVTLGDPLSSVADNANGGL
jgi:hypothetical protein